MLTGFGPGTAVDIHGVVARVPAILHLIVEEQSGGTLLLGVHAFPTLWVPVAVLGVRVVEHVLWGAVLGQNWRKTREMDFENMNFVYWSFSEHFCSQLSYEEVTDGIFINFIRMDSQKVVDYNKYIMLPNPCNVYFIQSIWQIFFYCQMFQDAFIF